MARQRRELRLLREVWNVFVNHAREIATLHLGDEERRALDRAWDYLQEKKEWEEVVAD